VTINRFVRSPLGSLYRSPLGVFGFGEDKRYVYAVGVYSSNQVYIVAVRASNGEVVWDHILNTGTHSSRLNIQATEDVIFIRAGSTLYALDANDRTQLWTVAVGSGRVSMIATRTRFLMAGDRDPYTGTITRAWPSGMTDITLSLGVLGNTILRASGTGAIAVAEWDGSAYVKTIDFSDTFGVITECLGCAISTDNHYLVCGRHTYATSPAILRGPRVCMWNPDGSFKWVSDLGFGNNVSSILFMAYHDARTGGMQFLSSSPARLYDVISNGSDTPIYGYSDLPDRWLTASFAPDTGTRHLFSRGTGSQIFGIVNPVSGDPDFLAASSIGSGSNTWTRELAFEPLAMTLNFAWMTS